jgi:NADH-quinone oxidoreductase subunit N
LIGGPTFTLLPPSIVTLLWILAAITMSIGNVLALLQNNVKRVLAYSSVAHSGYMLVGLAAMHTVPREALAGVLFYLAAYGIMNTGAFGVLMLLPPRDGRDDAAETFEDLAGQGRRHVGLGLAMAVCCFSLIGIPLTVGFLGKLLLIKPALNGGLTWLAIILIINAAVSAAYYLRIVAALFLRTDGPTTAATAVAGIQATQPQFAVRLGVVLSVLLTLVFGAIPPAAQMLTANATTGSQISAQAPAEPAAPAPRIALLSH